MERWTLSLALWALLVSSLISPAPLPSQRGVTATADSSSPGTPVHSFSSFPLVDVYSLQLPSPPVPVSSLVRQSQQFPHRPVSLSSEVSTPIPPAACPLQLVRRLPPLWWTDCSSDFVIIHTQTKLSMSFKVCVTFFTSASITISPLSQQQEIWLQVLPTLRSSTITCTLKFNWVGWQAPFFNLLFTVSMSVALALSPNAISQVNGALSWTCPAQLVIASMMGLPARITPSST